MRIGILGAGKIGRTLRDMLADVPRESATTLADVAPRADAVLDATDQHAVRDFAL